MSVKEEKQRESKGGGKKTTSTELALVETKHEKALLEQKHAMDLELETDDG